MISVRGLTKGFGDLVAVNALSFEVPDGSIVGLLGANGAGKTTALRMIAGVLQPDAGTVAIDDQQAPGATRAPAHDRVGALLDHAGLYSRLTARENVAYFAELRGVASGAARARAADVLDALGLGEKADRRVGTFSQGERMKVALARALVHNPTNLLLDEPTNGLDVPTVRGLRDVLRRLREAGTSIVLSSHILGEIEALCDSVLVIARGSLVAAGALADFSGASLEDAFMRATAAAEASC